MKKCKCFACGYSWFLNSNGNSHDHQHTCPKCGSDRIQFVLDSLIRDIQAGMSFTNPAAFCMPSGSRNQYKTMKWMTD